MTFQALLDWFPDKKGLASGLVIAGFGSGALFFTPAVNALQQKFLQMPTYLGKSVETITEGGKMFAKVFLIWWISGKSITKSKKIQSELYPL